MTTSMSGYVKCVLYVRLFTCDCIHLDWIINGTDLNQLKFVEESSNFTLIEIWFKLIVAHLMRSLCLI